MTRLLYQSLLAATFLLVTGPGQAADSTTSERTAGDIRYVLFDTTDGEILIELFPEKSPITVANFVKYVTDGFYDGTTFHRVIPGFVVQGGGYTTKFEDKETRDPIRNEARNKVRNERSTLSMARTNDPNSATSQFFINLKDNRSLDWDGMYGGYAVFGKVVKGMEEVVDDIALIPTGPGPEDAEVFFDRDVPFRPVYIKKAAVVTREAAMDMLKDQAAADNKAAE